MICGPTCGQGQVGHAGPGRVHLAAGPGLAHHVAGDQVAVQDVPGGGDEAAAVAHAAQRVRVHLEVPLAVGLGGEGRQTHQADERTLACTSVGEGSERKTERKKVRKKGRKGKINKKALNNSSNYAWGHYFQSSRRLMEQTVTLQLVNKH